MNNFQCTGDGNEILCKTCRFFTPSWRGVANPPYYVDFGCVNNGKCKNYEED